MIKHKSQLVLFSRLEENRAAYRVKHTIDINPQVSSLLWNCSRLNHQAIFDMWKPMFKAIWLWCDEQNIAWSTQIKKNSFQIPNITNFLWKGCSIMLWVLLNHGGVRRQLPGEVNSGGNTWYCPILNTADTVGLAFEKFLKVDFLKTCGGFTEQF